MSSLPLIVYVEILGWTIRGSSHLYRLQDSNMRRTKMTLSDPV